MPNPEKKEPMVTRTMTVTDVKVLCMNLEEEKPVHQVVSINGKYKDNKKLFKLVEKALNSEAIKVIKIESQEQKTSLRGVPESIFLANSVEITRPARKIEE